MFLGIFIPLLLGILPPVLTLMTLQVVLPLSLRINTRLTNHRVGGFAGKARNIFVAMCHILQLMGAFCMNKWIVLFLIVVATFVCAGPVKAGASAQIQSAEVLKDLIYASINGRMLLLDLYLPTSGHRPVPVILWVHGGGWRQGSKENALGARLASEGYAVASINYRLSGEAIFPAQLEDCKAAVRWLRAHAADYGLDQNRIGAWGSSAGGHLAALLGVTGDHIEFDIGDNLAYSSAVQAVCDYYGPTDLTVIGSTPGYTVHARADSAESLLLGGAASANLQKAAAASPVSYISADDAPFLIVHGTNDPVVPPAQSKLLYDALVEAKVEADLHMVENAGHGGPEFASNEMLKTVVSFFNRYLRNSKQ